MSEGSERPKKKKHVWKKVDKDEIGVLSPEGKIMFIGTSCGDLISREEINFVFEKGYDPSVVPINGEISFWARGEEMVRTTWHKKHCHKFPLNFDPFSFIRDLGLSERETNFELHSPGVAVRMKTAMIEARIWTTAVTNAQGSLMFLAAKIMNSPACSEFYLTAIEAIVNNRIQKATQLEAFVSTIEKVDSGKINWLDIVEEDKVPDGDRLDNLFDRKHQVLLTYNIVLQLAQEWKNLREELVSFEDPAVINYLRHFPVDKEMEIVSQVFANYCDTISYKHLQLVAQCIGRGAIYKENQVFTLIDFIQSVPPSYPITFLDVFPALLYGEI